MEKFRLEYKEKYFVELYYGDCLEVMSSFPYKSIDMVLCDLPFGKTKNTWDSIIPLYKLWPIYKKIIKTNGVIVLFGQDKFSAKLMLSNEKMHRYNLIWEKTSPTGFLNSGRMPLRSHEDILVFYKKLPTYKPQKTFGHERKISTVEHKRNSKKTSNYSNHNLMTYDSAERFPTSILKFPKDTQKEALHPTQKPIALLKYLIKTYTDEENLVLDNCMGSCSTGVACMNINRNFIGIEIGKENFDISVKRVKQAKQELPWFL